MLTSFILNQNNLITEYQKPRKPASNTQQLSNYIREQDRIIKAFNTQLENNIIRAVLGAPELEKVNLVIIIKNALRYDIQINYT
ncbi:hypothetical protein I8748_16365 [Nostoc sp. CENA67]|uniref:Uncharacterized protein n=1 Tax=Amazonocrinis nigriterrae CENA67 TaxID=2794033 RepID=A0A8J7HTB6_9NOST|nr:hypothetical protein [Amazonocrinis nigriterrae]MBH8563745.1 hypothetical protein [Amazonocrinis nigriterrae CENA67]